MKPLRRFLFPWVFFGCLLLSFLEGRSKYPLKGLYIAKYTAGNLLKDELHSLSLFNESETMVDISGYVVVTRYYVLRFPKQTFLPPMQSLTLSKSDRAALKGTIRKKFSDISDFLIRIPSAKTQGDYVVLMNPKNEVVEGLFISEERQPSFLPDKGELITAKQERIPFRIPAVNAYAWQKVGINPDPAMVLVKVGGKWMITSRQKNLFPAVKYQNIITKYIEGIVSIKWETAFEADCYQHTIERSFDKKQVTEVGKITANYLSDKKTSYSYYDANVPENKLCYYRISHTDKFYNTISSDWVETYTSTTNFPGEFSMALLGSPSENTGINLRFQVKDKRAIRIRLFDNRFKEVALLLDEMAEPNSQSLIRYEKPLSSGRYFLVAETGIKRFYTAFIL